jgi:putative pyruvate formate lyase activating enzyme
MLSLKTLEGRAQEVYNKLNNCTLCPRNCRVNRLQGEWGYCHVAKYALISSFGPHFGEERELVGFGGSGTIFFAGCNLRCVFCQNYQISQLYEGQERTDEELAQIMLELQQMGCHNINFVSPTHVVPQILKALVIARKKGLTLPLVYNSGGYESKETLKLLEGIIDIYMPDAKYANKELAKKYSDADNYPQILKMALKEMYRQVGNLVLEDDGVAKKGLLVRHLILPHELSGTKEILKFIAHNISKETYVNIMDQYHPIHKAFCYKELSRAISSNEYNEAVTFARKLGLYRGF